MKVFIYELSTCPWCRKTRQFFEERGIPFEYVDYDMQDEAEQEKIMEKMKRLAGASSFPLTMIDDDFVIGYDAEKLSKLIEKHGGGKA